MKRTQKKERKNKSLITEPIDVELSIDEDELNEELMNQPLLYRKWSTFEAGAATEVKKLELRLEHAKAQAYLEAKESGIKMTVKDLEASVTLNENVIKLNEELIEAQEVLADMKTAVRAFLQRHDALKDLCANKRKELI